MTRWRSPREVPTFSLTAPIALRCTANSALAGAAQPRNLSIEGPNSSVATDLHAPSAPFCGCSMAQAAAQSVVRAVAARKCKAHALVRLADEVAPQLSSVQGRRVSAGLPQCRALRGRSGFGRRSRKGADRKLGKLNVHVLASQRRRGRRRGAVHKRAHPQASGARGIHWPRDKQS
jgi:hypothetical protein